MYCIEWGLFGFPQWKIWGGAKKMVVESAVYILSLQGFQGKRWSEIVCLCCVFQSPVPYAFKTLGNFAPVDVAAPYWYFIFAPFHNNLQHGVHIMSWNFIELSIYNPDIAFLFTATISDSLFKVKILCHIMHHFEFAELHLLTHLVRRNPFGILCNLFCFHHTV